MRAETQRPGSAFSRHRASPRQKNAHTRTALFPGRCRRGPLDLRHGLLLHPRFLMPLTRKSPDQLRVGLSEGGFHAVDDLSGGARQALIISRRVTVRVASHCCAPTSETRSGWVSESPRLPDWVVGCGASVEALEGFSGEREMPTSDGYEVCLCGNDSASELHPVLLGSQTPPNGNVKAPDLLVNGVRGCCDVWAGNEIDAAEGLAPGAPVDCRRGKHALRDVVGSVAVHVAEVYEH